MKGEGRRTFIRKVALGGGMTAADVDLAGQKGEPKRGRAAQFSEYPRVYSGRRLALIAFPLGGVGTGCVSLGGRGHLQDWEIFNRSEKGRSICRRRGSF